jgi:anion-transporting  ArsA/GET3 family ATPase
MIHALANASQDMLLSTDNDPDAGRAVEALQGLLKAYEEAVKVQANNRQYAFRNLDTEEQRHFAEATTYISRLATIYGPKVAER